MSTLFINTRFGTSLIVTGLIVSMAGIAHAQCYKLNESSTTEWNTDRPGQDYYNFSLPFVPCTWSPCFDLRLYTCEDACFDDDNCLAWTYVKPASYGSAAHCWLKNGVPNATPNSQTVSGLKFEYNIDRPGSDYDTVYTSSAAACDDLCYFDDDCLAWTWVKTNGACWLKGSVPGAIANSHTISGYYDWQCIH